jgi:hypothetical protein
MRSRAASKARKAGPREIREPAAIPPFWFWVGVAGALAFAVLVAMGPAWTVLSRPEGVFDDPDAQFHLRRTVRTIEAGSVLPPVFDELEAFPEGGHAVWPPLHDAALALLARAGGSTQADPRRGIFLAAALPVLQLAAVMGLVGWIVHRRVGRRGALVAVWLAALSIALFRSASFGKVDHNGTEVLGWALLAALALEIGDRSESGVKGAAAFSAAWSVAVLVAMGSFPGLVMGAAVLAGAVSLADAIARRSRGRVAGTFALGFGLAASALHVLASLRVPPDPADPWRLGPAFTLALCVAAAGLALLSVADGYRLRGEARGWSPLALAGLGLAALTAAVEPGAAWLALARGFSFVGARDPWLATITEFQPMTAELPRVMGILPAASVAFAVLALLATWRFRPRTPQAFTSAAIALLAVLPLATAQARFTRDLVVVAAIAAGLGWNVLAASRFRIRVAGAVAVLSVLLASPGLGYYVLRSVGRADAPKAPRLDVEVASAILAHTPKPGARPEWGVLAPWDCGHAVLWRTGRAVALNNFGSAHPGFGRKMRIFLEASPAAATAEMDALRLRYLVTADPPRQIPATAASIGLDARRWTFATPSGGDGRPPAVRSLLFRLHVQQGGPVPEDSDLDRSALARFRKVWESPIQLEGTALPRAVLWELLPATSAVPAAAASTRSDARVTQVHDRYGAPPRDSAPSRAG